MSEEAKKTVINKKKGSMSKRYEEMYNNVCSEEAIDITLAQVFKPTFQKIITSIPLPKEDIDTVMTVFDSNNKTTNEK